MIEHVRLSSLREGNTLEHVQTIKHELVRTPNNLVAVDKNKFYVSNDHRRKSHWVCVVIALPLRLLRSLTWSTGDAVHRLASGKSCCQSRATSSVRLRDQTRQNLADVAP